MALFLGVDTGTSGTKAVLIDERGKLLASDTQEYPLSTPQPQWAEQSPDSDWWPAAACAIQTVLAKSGRSGREIGSVGLTGQMHGSVFLDKAGQVIRPALLWCDARTGGEVQEIYERLGGEAGLFATIGQPVVASFTAPKILWLRNHEPRAYERVAQVLLPKDYIRYRLTGEYAAEVSDASGTSLLDIRTRRWSEKMLSALEIPREWLPRLVESPEVTGTVSAEAAALTGLAAGTPVVGGGGDQAAGAVGCGVVARGLVSSSLGTSGVVFAHSDECFIDPKLRLTTFCHAVPGAWHLMGCMLSSGGSLRWWRDTFAPGESYEAIAAGAQTAPAGCEGLMFLPYLTGERTPYADPSARGVFFGATLRSEKTWLARAIFEGVAYSFKDAFGLLEEIGVPVSEVRAIGGGARSPFWLQMMADMSGQTHSLPAVDEGPAYGAALLAGVGAGAYGSVAQACEACISAHPAATCDPAAAAIYARWHPLYRSLYPALKDAFAEAARLT